MPGRMGCETAVFLGGIPGRLMGDACAGLLRCTSLLPTVTGGGSGSTWGRGVMAEGAVTVGCTTCEEPIEGVPVSTL
jgi:hypothetical protein